MGYFSVQGKTMDCMVATAVLVALFHIYIGELWLVYADSNSGNDENNSGMNFGRYTTSKPEPIPIRSIVKMSILSKEALLLTKSMKTTTIAVMMIKNLTV